MKIVFNNNTEHFYDIDEGFTVIENYNETLDSANIRISHLSNQINIEPLDDATLYLDDEETVYKYFCIDNFTCIQEAIGQSDTTYSYTISLFSQTKKLEGIILPNLSITPRKIGNKITISDYLTHINILYGPRKRVGNVYRLIWSIDSTTIENVFDEIECPEMQWTNPTFREVFNDLLMVKDRIVVLKNNTISAINLTRITNGNLKQYNYIQQSMSSDDYISEIRMDLQNVMQTNIANINNTVSTSEYLTFISDNSIITSENYYLKTQFPILDIKHLWLMCFLGYYDENEAQTKTILVKTDLCHLKTTWADNNNQFDSDIESTLVYEKQEYDVLLNAYRKQIVGLDRILSESIYDYYSKYKNFCVYFTRNSNKIEGFSNSFKPKLKPQEFTIEYLKKISVYHNYPIDDPNTPYRLSDINEGDNAWFTAFFQIEYETTYNAVFQASKKDKPHNNRVIADNQTNAWVDAYSQGFLEYQKANRLGNLQKMYNQRVSRFNDLYVIGNKVGNDIIYRTEYQIYKNHIECNALATKNYVLQNYFTGIKSKIRTWVNAREEAFIRHDLKKYYCEFSYTPYNEVVETENNGKEFARYLLSSLTNNNDIKPIKYALIRTSILNNEYFPSSSSKYALNCITRLIGNSIVLTAGFDDNWIVAKHPNTGIRDAQNPYYNDQGIITQNDIEVMDYNYPPHFEPQQDSNDPIGGITTNYLKYCDENGEFQDIKLYFLDEFKCSSKIKSNGELLDNNDDVKEIIYNICSLPEINDTINTDYKFGYQMTLYKDNKEKPVISTQFEFNCIDNDVAFTRLFLERQDMIRTIENSILNAYVSNLFIKTIVPPGAQQVPFSGLTISCPNDYQAKITVTAAGTGKYIYLCDNENNLIFVFDRTRDLYLNIRRYR